MLPAAMVGLDLHPMQAGVVAVRRQRRPPAQVGDSPATDDPGEGQPLCGNIPQPFATDLGEHRRRGIGVELGQRAVEIGEDDEGFVSRQSFDRMLHIRKHGLSVAVRV